jgi:hypothetical protein
MGFASISLSFAICVIAFEILGYIPDKLLQLHGFLDTFNVAVFHGACCLDGQKQNALFGFFLSNIQTLFKQLPHFPELHVFEFILELNRFSSFTITSFSWLIVDVSSLILL